MKGKKVLALIIILLILIVIIITILLVNSRQKKISSQNIIIDDMGNIDESNVEIYYNTLEVKDSTKFYTVSECVDKYIKLLKNRDAESIYKILDKKFVTENNINQENLLDTLQYIGNGDKTEIKKMNYIDGDVFQQYSILILINNNEDLFIKLNMDTSNRTFSIIPILNKSIKSINEIELTNKLEYILENEYNQYEYIRYTTEEIVYKYFNYYTELMYNDTKKAYELLDTEYRNKRFSTLNEFTEYVQKIQPRIDSVILNKYYVERNSDCTIYTIVDNYSNYYIIKEYSVMKFSIQLDNYTIKPGNYEQEYLKLNESQKMLTNLNIFLSMVNNKDYNSIYERLDESFKNNKFSNIEQLKQYIDKEFFNCNVIESIDAKNEGNVYIYKVLIKSNNTFGALDKEVTVIMQLKEETDFVMSFSF